MFIAVLLPVAGFAQSQPSPNPAEPGQAIERSAGSGDKQAAADQPSTAPSPALLQSLNTKKAEQDAQTQATQAQPATPSDHASWYSDPNWTIVGLTCVLLVVAIVEHCKNREAIRHNKVVERAYVSMSHEPPGLYCLQIGSTPITNPPAIPFMAEAPVVVRVQIANHGATPTNVLAVVVTSYIGRDLPDSKAPPFTDHNTWGAFFLMPNEGHFLMARMIHSGIKEQDFAAIQAGELFFWAVGYVDYEDAFGGRHRARYARRYSPHSTDNNLVFETKPGYSADEPRKTA